MCARPAAMFGGNPFGVLDNDSDNDSDDNVLPMAMPRKADIFAAQGKAKEVVKGVKAGAAMVSNNTDTKTVAVKAVAEALSKAQITPSSDKVVVAAAGEECKNFNRNRTAQAFAKKVKHPKSTKDYANKMPIAVAALPQNSGNAPSTPVRSGQMQTTGIDMPRARGRSATAPS